MNTSQMVCMVLVMAGVTYLIRMLPFVCMRRRIRSVYLRSLLYYLPYAVLAAMTFPAIFFIAVPSGAAPTLLTVLPAVMGTLVALVTAWLRRPLPLVAACACLVVWVTELVTALA